MTSRSDFDLLAERIFGYMPKSNPGETPRPYKADQFQKRLGIDIYQYEGFYAEIGFADAAEGPVTPATERLPIKPILAIKQSRRGHYYVRGLEYQEGLFNRDKSKVWIKTEQYDELLGDDYFEQIEQQLAEAFEAAEASESDRPIQMVDLGTLDVKEREIFDKLRSGVDFSELSSSERELIAKAIEAKQQEQNDE